MDDSDCEYQPSLEDVKITPLPREKSLRKIQCPFNCKLDGEAPLITDPPPISLTTLSKNKIKINVTCDI